MNGCVSQWSLKLDWYNTCYLQLNPVKLLQLLYLQTLPKKNQVNWNFPQTGIMESVSHAFPRVEGSVPRRALKVPARGASSHFVGSTIVILSSYAVATLAMNCGKKMQDQRMGTLKNWSKKQLLRTQNTLALISHSELPFNSVKSVHVYVLMLRVSAGFVSAAEETQHQIELMLPSCCKFIHGTAWMDSGRIRGTINPVDAQRGAARTLNNVQIYFFLLNGSL